MGTLEHRDFRAPDETRTPDKTTVELVNIARPRPGKEVVRLEKPGAGRVVGDAIEEHGKRWIVVAEPEGNEFRVCNAGVSE